MVKMAGVSAWCTVLLASFGSTLNGYYIGLVIISSCYLLSNRPNANVHYLGALVSGTRTWELPY